MQQLTLKLNLKNYYYETTYSKFQVFKDSMAAPARLWDQNHLGQDPSEQINQVRERAYAENYIASEHSFTSGSTIENANAILDERLKEFVGEGKRWWDLRRAGDEFVYQEIENMNSGVSYKLELSISQGMIGNNPLLEQTPGYEQ